MISIITCTIRPEHYSKMVKSFNENTPKDRLKDIEFVKIEKPESMAKGYNEGIKKAKGDILCFVHEDVRCRHFDWIKVMETFYKNYPDACISGVVGTVRLSFLGGHWFSGMRLGRGRFIQWETEIDNSPAVPVANRPPVFEVVAVDGLVLFAPKEKLVKLNKGVGFDETYKYFHLYDSDICLAAKELGYKNYVFEHLLFQHLSIQDINHINDHRWPDSQKIFWSKWGRNDHYLDERLDKPAVQQFSILDHHK